MNYNFIPTQFHSSINSMIQSWTRDMDLLHAKSSRTACMSIVRTTVPESPISKISYENIREHCQLCSLEPFIMSFDMTLAELNEAPFILIVCEGDRQEF